MFLTFEKAQLEAASSYRHMVLLGWELTSVGGAHSDGLPQTPLILIAFPAQLTLIIYYADVISEDTQAFSES